MSYYNFGYLFIELPIAILLYRLIPKKYRYVYLFILSMAFFLVASCKNIIFLLLSIFSIWLSAIILGKLDDKKSALLEKEEVLENKKKIKKEIKSRKKLVLVLCVVFNVLFLFVFKYFKFFNQNTNILSIIFNLDKKGVKEVFKVLKMLTPIGISFYTLTALSYLIDVYNNKIKPNKNIIKVALFISFFPSIIEGPITRYEEVSDSLFSGNGATYKGICFGYVRVFYGIFKKMVIADRLNAIVKPVFLNFNGFSGGIIAIATIAYTIMLYAEFSGTMDIVLGTGDMFGVNIPENFRQPFFSKSVSEFWTRWHISLGAWFRDYIFYPVSLSKPVKHLAKGLRKLFGNHFGALISGSIALLCVWLLNGLWHGAGWHFILFGVYHFLMILLGNIFEPLVIKIYKKLKINRENTFVKIFRCIKTTILIFIGELIFRANSIHQALYGLKKIFTNFSINSREFAKLNFDLYDLIIIILALVLVLVVGILKEKKINIRDALFNTKLWIRWIIIYALILSILFLGAYGVGYIPMDPIYADF